MILFYTDKTTQAYKVFEAISEILQTTYPNQTIKLIHNFTHNVQMSYPHQIKWMDYPYVGDYRYKFAHWDDWEPKEFKNGILVPSSITTEEINKADEIIYISDPYITYCFHFECFLEKFKTKKATKVSYLKLMELNKKYIQKQWLKKEDEDISYWKEQTKQGRLKRYFEYLFNINSLGILGSVLKELEIDNNKYHLSKYTLQLFYLLNQPEYHNLTEGWIFYHMQKKYKGTGKYNIKDFPHCRLGTPSSGTQIIENLINMNLIIGIKKEESSKLQYQISPKGKQLINMLHKDCCDLDLPFRLVLWGKRRRTYWKS